MSRNKGIVNYASNFEVLAQAPLDARMLVGQYADLVIPATWEDADNLVWLFDGALVVVANDPSAGIYWLKDSVNYTDFASWELAGSATPFDPSALYSYIDGSLAQRDASIEDLYSRIDIIDGSISFLVNWNSSQDASIERIDASIADLYSRDTSIGVINIGDGSANIFAGYDTSNNIQLRTLTASGAATVTQIGNDIIIGIDGSFGGEINYGVNVGSGDASIYYQKVGDALQFRELLAGPNITLDVSDNLIVIGATGGTGGAGIDGGVWITNISPNGPGNVGDKSYSSDGNVLDSCLTDTSTLTVSILALPGHTNYKPVITIDSNPVSLSADPDKPLWTGSYNIQYNFADVSITALHEDGASWSTTVDADTPAVILSANFIGTYPGSQTELKAGDTMQINVVTDVSVVSIAWDNSGALTSGTYSASGTNNTFTVTIANNGNSAVLRGFTLRATKSTGSTSLDYISTVHGSVELTDVVNCNNLYPSISFGSVTYPGGQGAIKSTESANVANTVTNYDTVIYTSPTGELTVNSPAVYEASKQVNYLSGGYNITTNNLRIVANRAANASSTTNNSIVWIANTPATLSVSNPAARLRSGGNDGTSAQSHTITISAGGQRLLAAPTLVKDTGGTWLGGAFSWSSSATSFTRSLSVTDSMAKGTYNWGAISGTNLAGITTTANSGSTQYILGGFVQRTIALAAFGWQSNINVEVSDYSKLSSTGSGQALAWSVTTMGTRRTIGDSSRPHAGEWSASATFTNPTTINILDKSATDSASQASSFTIQEGI